MGERKPNIQHHRQTGNLGRRIELSNVLFIKKRYEYRSLGSSQITLTLPNFRLQ